jgi:hypothetical protein
MAGKVMIMTIGRDARTLTLALPARVMTVCEIVVVTTEDAMTDLNEKISVTDMATDQSVGREAGHQINLSQNVTHDDRVTKIAIQNLNIAKPVKRLKHKAHGDLSAHQFADVNKNVSQTRKSSLRFVPI